MRRLRIYGFRDPRDGKLHYIGKSRNPYVRLGEHYRDHRPRTTATPNGGFARRYNPEMAAWLDSLIDDDIFPEVVILHIVEVGENWQALETKFIADYREAGHPLVNKALGGQGSKGVKRTAEWKAERSRWMKGRKLSEETKTKISEHMKYSPERIAKMRVGWEEWSKTEQGKEFYSNLQRGKRRSDAHKKAISAGASKWWSSLTEEQRQEFNRRRGESYRARTEKRKSRYAASYDLTT